MVPPAVNNPELEIVPSPATLQVTAWLTLPEPTTVALNCFVCPEMTEAVVGVMVMELTDEGVGVGVGPEDVPALPHPAKNKTETSVNHFMDVFLP